MNNKDNSERKGNGRSPESPPPSPKRAKPSGVTQPSTSGPASSSQPESAVLNRPKVALSKEKVAASGSKPGHSSVLGSAGSTSGSSKPANPKAAGSSLPKASVKQAAGQGLSTLAPSVGSTPITDLINQYSVDTPKLGAGMPVKAPHSLSTGSSTIMPDFSSLAKPLPSAPKASANAVKLTLPASQVKSTEKVTAPPAFSWSANSSAFAAVNPVPAASGSSKHAETPADVLAAARAEKKAAPRDWEKPVGNPGEASTPDEPSQGAKPHQNATEGADERLAIVMANLVSMAPGGELPKAAVSASAVAPVPAKPLLGSTLVVPKPSVFADTSVPAKVSSTQPKAVATSTGVSAPTGVIEPPPSPFLRPSERVSGLASGSSGPAPAATTNVGGGGATVAPPATAGQTASIAGGKTLDTTTVPKLVSTSSAAIPLAPIVPVQQTSQQQPNVVNLAPQLSNATDKPVIALQVVSQPVPQQQSVFPTAVVSIDKDEGDLPDAPPCAIVHAAVDQEFNMPDAPLDLDDQDEDVVMKNAPVLRGYGGRRIPLSQKHAVFMKMKKALHKRGMNDRQTKMTVNLKGTGLFPKFCRNFTDPQLKIDRGGCWLVGRSTCKWPIPA